MTKDGVCETFDEVMEMLHKKYRVTNDNQLANYFGVSRQYIHQWRSLRRIPRKHAARIYKIHGDVIPLAVMLNIGNK